MTEATIAIPAYNNEHSDFENNEYFPATKLLTFNQMIDVLADPWVSIVCDHLGGDLYLSTYGSSEIEPIMVIELTADATDAIEPLVVENLIMQSSINGKNFGTMASVWDIFRDNTGSVRSKEADDLANKLGLSEFKTKNMIRYVSEESAPLRFDIVKK